MNVRLPFNFDAEKQVLGSILQQDNRLWEISELVQPADFHADGHGQIFSVAVQILLGGRRVSPISVADYLRSDGKGKLRDGYLDELIDEVINPADAPQYARQVARLARRRRMIVAMQDGMSKLASLDIAAANEDVIDEIEAAIFEAGRETQEKGAWLHEFALNNAVAVQTELERTTPKPRGLNWGLTSVSDVVGPLMPKRVVVLAGVSGGGKSALARQCAVHMARQRPGVMFSLEMDGEEHAAREQAPLAGVKAWQIEQARVSQAELERLFETESDLRPSRLWIDDSTRLNMQQIRARLMRKKQQHDIGFAVIDHLLLVSPMNPKAEINERVTEVTREAKNIAKDLDIGILLLGQLKDDVWQRPNNRPRNTDLYGGRVIEQNADAIMFVHRPEVFHATTKPTTKDPHKIVEWQVDHDLLKGKAEIIGTKRRGGRANQSRECHFDGDKTAFRDLQDKGPRTLLTPAEEQEVLI